MEFTDLNRDFWTIMSLHVPPGSEETFLHSISQSWMFHDHFSVCFLNSTEGGLWLKTGLFGTVHEAAISCPETGCKYKSRPAGKGGLQTWRSAPPIFHWGHLFSRLNFLSQLLSINLLFLGRFCSSRISWLLRVTPLSSVQLVYSCKR